MNKELFETRHIGTLGNDRELMLKEIGIDSIDKLVDLTIPEGIRLKNKLNIPDAMSEFEYLNAVKEIGAKNKVYKTYIGMGYYNTIVPPVIQRNVLENPGWYTAYTPYQAEIAQGRLESLLNFQTMVSDLTGMEIANASLLDESTAAAEAMSMLFNTRKRDQVKDNVVKFFISEECFPQTIDVVKTRAKGFGIELVIGNHKEFTPTAEFFGALVQYPAANGEIHEYGNLVTQLHELKAKLVVAADILSLALLTPPGEFGADVVVGTTQRFGVPMGFGGPHAAYFATSEEYKRNLPGRIIGVSKDRHGNNAMRMALQTREQHIRREKATSNICTAQALLANMAAMYAVYHGQAGIKRIATNVHSMTTWLAEGLELLDLEVQTINFFDTITVKTDSLEDVKAEALKNEINFFYENENTLQISLDETTRLEDVNAILAVFSNANSDSEDIISIDPEGEKEAISFDDNFKRNSEFLTHQVFNMYHTETDMMRYIKKLENRDMSLTHSMISLGSCTMKLNSASELMPITWSEFSNIHPFVPNNQAEGYHQIIDELDEMLSEITGFDKVSMQPNSGAQGEFAGLMVIRAYHESRGDFNRDIMIIPASAHGTNPASAVMAGMKVVVTKCDDKGNIDVEDLRVNVEKHSENLAGVMITYPSTHGVFEASIIEITDLIHEHGGQVYMDGANMNAQVGLTSPGNIGADVCHLNLHKTFAIPHGGGGPGVGPIGVAKQLTPFLPGNPLIKTGGEQAITSISGAPFGSALILLISYGYIKMLGEEGIRKSTEHAILNANYIQARLKNDYDILYKGENGTVAHEMILDCRDFKTDTGIEVADIAKRLIDYGFHAPTVSFPVANTLMVEPTESESKPELDRFCDAMIAIRNEIREIEEGVYDKENNLLKNAPHILADVMEDKWPFAYPKKQAIMPLPYLNEFKFWAHVSRVDQGYGDRNLICSCPSIEEYAMEEA
ncbi:MAG: aminomethyl-transferring glycine dehydrogenase [Flavobacteriales bacterium]|nr:aminomethyl-transferring glycine dehydrogenase [Flavobacteriales bacterium]